ncbi:CidA/LrgA family protein [Orrella sp. JC864]|uniref:CidA/LrgA family protein n=1 Tax=Orrella sp. JC864 TaxID=3120298 RepID=UPI00300A0734
MLVAIALVLSLQLAGELIVQALGLPAPGSLLGLGLLFALLLALGRVPRGLQRLAQLMLRHLMLLLMPAVAGIAVHYSLLARDWLAFLLACVLGTLLTLLVTAWTFRLMMRRQGAGAR